jgi:hypothetical protein
MTLRYSSSPSVPSSSSPLSRSRPIQRQNVNLADCSSLLEAGEAIAIAEQVEKVPVQYQKLFERLQAHRSESGWLPADVSIALVSVNEESEAQQRFTLMLQKAGFETDVSDYRDNYVSLPAGRKPADFYDQSKERQRQRPLVSLASRLAYALGVLARHSEPQVIVVSHAFELYWPMLNFAERNSKARVGLAYFSDLLDYRWKQAGLFESGSPIKFFDLGEHSAELLGGIVLRRAATSQVSMARSGLSRL